MPARARARAQLWIILAPSCRFGLKLSGGSREHAARYQVRRGLERARGKGREIMLALLAEPAPCCGERRSLNCNLG